VFRPSLLMLRAFVALFFAAGVASLVSLTMVVGAQRDGESYDADQTARLDGARVYVNARRTATCETRVEGQDQSSTFEVGSSSTRGVFGLSGAYVDPEGPGSVSCPTSFDVLRDPGASVALADRQLWALAPFGLLIVAGAGAARTGRALGLHPPTSPST